MSLENHEFLVEVRCMQYYKDFEDEHAPGKFIIISNRQQLSDEFSEIQLIKLRGIIRGKDAEADQKKSKHQLVDECYKAITKMKSKDNKIRVKKGKNSKVQLAREIFKKTNTISKKDLAEAVGHDIKGCAVMVSILRNPKRTKDPLWIAYNKHSGYYSLHKTEAGMKNFMEEI